MVIEGGGGAQPSQNVDGQSQYRYMFKFILNKQCNFSQTIPKKKKKNSRKSEYLLIMLPGCKGLGTLEIFMEYARGQHKTMIYE